MTVEHVMQQLQEMGNDTTKRIYQNHGATEPLFGVKIGDLKSLVKRIKTNHELARELYATGNSDAMYLAVLIADPMQMTVEELDAWAQKAYWYMLIEHAVAALAAESPHALPLARSWIRSDAEMIQAAGWATYSGWLSIADTAAIDIEELDKRLDHIRDHLHHSKNRVRYAMNNFVISVGGYVPELQDKALDVAQALGAVQVDMGGTACKVPSAPDYIRKMVERGSAQRKRKAVRC